MTDLSATLDPKVDQLTADHLISGPKNITVTRVSGNDDPQQPISIHYDGGEGLPFKPCLTMRRLLVLVWGGDGTKYVGRQMTLYRDPEVSYGGLKTGGVRISHVSDIAASMTVALTKTRGKKSPITVKPLRTEKPTAPSFDFDTFERTVTAELENSIDAETLASWWKSREPERLAARDADRTRAGKIATSVTEKIASLTENTD